MSVAKLLLSGLLVASGLILGAFTLHAAFAPEWEVRASCDHALLCQASISRGVCGAGPGDGG